VVHRSQGGDLADELGEEGGRNRGEGDADGRTRVQDDVLCGLSAVLTTDERIAPWPHQSRS
jgi:hypothetical protein